MHLARVFAVLTACFLGCGDDAPSCADLEAQMDKCPDSFFTSSTDAAQIAQSRAAGKQQIRSFCPSASEECRTCLDGKICGNTESCDSVCKKK